MAGKNANNLKISFFVLSNEEISKEWIKSFEKEFHGVFALYDRVFYDTSYSITITPETNPECYIKTVEDVLFLHFGNARRRAQEELLKRYPDTDYILWLDSDDDWKKFLNDYRQQKDALVKLLTEQKPDIVYCPYSYIKKNESLIIYYPRLYNPKKAAWTDDPVHETLDHKSKKPKGEAFPALTVSHLKKDHQASIKRNFAILRACLMDPTLGKVEDGRLWYLFARESYPFDINFAIETGLIALTMNQAPHYKEATLALLGDLYWINGDLESSERYVDQLLEINPNNMLGLTSKARILLAKGDYQAAASTAFWALSLLKNPKMVLENMLGVQGLDPVDTQRLAYTSLLSALHELRDEKGVRAVIKEIEGLMIPGDENGKDLANVIRVIKTYWDKKSELEKTGTYEGFANSDYAIGFLKKNKMYQKWPEKSVVIYAPRGVYSWDGASVISGGAGGSETAVVEISERLVKYGYNVVVYGMPEYECEVNGVKYLHHTSINLADEFDTLVVFREEAVFSDVNPTAKKKYLWLQDVAKVIFYTPEYLNRVDKILVLSEYHRNTLKHVPEEKIFYTTNGINVGLIEEVEKSLGDYKRDYKKYIYASSPDRGLESLLAMWEELKKDGVITDEKLYWYYGWNSFGAVKGSERWEWKEKMSKKMKELGVVEGGRIGKRELYKEMLTANHLLYPYQRPAETSCIVAMEAQATGLIPVTTGLDALKETQQWGVKQPDLADYYSALGHIILAYKNKTKEEPLIQKYRTDMAKWARDKYSWDVVINDWLTLLKD